MNKHSTLSIAAIVAASAFALHSQVAGAADDSKQSSSGQQGVPGVELNVGDNASDRGLPGVEMNVGRDGDQKNIDTQTLGAGSDRTTTNGDQKAIRPMRKDRG